MGHKEYFISDTHFSHKGVIKFERTQFATVEEHDEFLVKMYKKLAEKVNEGDTVYHLGDWGNTDYLWVNMMLKGKTVFVMGNHDKKSDIDIYRQYFDEVHEHPYFLTDRILLSHIPYVFGEDDVLNVCGHLHAATLESNNHIVCSVDVIGYNPVTRSTIDGALSRLPKRKTNFLEESYAHMYKFTEKRNKDDVVTDENGLINLDATLVLRKLQTNGEQK